MSDKTRVNLFWFFKAVNATIVPYLVYSQLSGCRAIIRLSACQRLTRKRWKENDMDKKLSVSRPSFTFSDISRSRVRFRILLARNKLVVSFFSDVREKRTFFDNERRKMNWRYNEMKKSLCHHLPWPSRTDQWWPPSPAQDPERKIPSRIPPPSRKYDLDPRLKSWEKSCRNFQDFSRHSDPLPLFTTASF